MPNNDNFLDPDATLFAEPVGTDDDNLVMDLDNIDDSRPKFEALPVGIYNCIIENTEYGISKNNNPMITWTFKVVDPQYEGRLLFNHTTLNNDVGKGRLKRILSRVLPDIPMNAFRPRAFCDEGSGLGYPCRVKVRIRSYEGQRRNDVQDVLPPAEQVTGFLDQ